MIKVLVMYCHGCRVVVVVAKRILADNGPILLCIWNANWKSVPINIEIMDLLLYKYYRIVLITLPLTSLLVGKKTTIQQPELATF